MVIIANRVQSFGNHVARLIDCPNLQVSLCSLRSFAANPALRSSWFGSKMDHKSSRKRHCLAAKEPREHKELEQDRRQAANQGAW
jgi:hypothetical protein